MNKAITYYFTIRAISPVYFGDSEKGSVVKNWKGEPIVLGNALGGALRDYVQRILQSLNKDGQEQDRKKVEELIYGSLGGQRKGSSTLEESSIYISDGHIHYAELGKKEGTAIDPQYGSAKDQHKYTLEYLPIGTEIHFRIECDVLLDRETETAKEEQQLRVQDFHTMIGTWAKGIATQQLLLGGQKSNGFGRFELIELQRVEFALNSKDALDEYIFRRESAERTPIDWQALAQLETKQEQVQVISFFMSGYFPYGVYQSFNLDKNRVKQERELTGLQTRQSGYYMPATSLKGLMRNEVALLIKRMLMDEPIDADELNNKVNAKCAEWFGSLNQRGKVVFSDIEFENSKLVQMERPKQKDENGAEPDKHPVYIKIDRLTGGGYSKALKHQQEVQGAATIRFELVKGVNSGPEEEEGFIFPLVYVLRRIGAGHVPLGGRTVIGLGQFAADKVKIEIGQNCTEIETTEALTEQSKAWLKQHFEDFKGWCKK
ncbi:RAMP superfamily CRISPR-associated protein [Paenibacillus sp. 481]|uniref:RAMP superfamily CRISPR-associated protein n=1 Tax=Paenibacillus sp. 481 TaxID=2835869 RepID=UPI001E62DD40|nr:RAMP superfamily CRISPR-associated protein [Paenibacillus sp. 481]UHA72131.1 hypothetical protein KIK04_15655 [Paenibacillus sp. 481]